ncbi:FAD binding domain-containing protein [bacterium]|nr:FAD binding domain-containing protein [bacterium]
MAIVFRPKDLDEALRIRYDKAAIPFAGGTDLMVKHKQCLCSLPSFDKPVLHIGHLKELRVVTSDNENIYFGGACTLTEILEHKLTPKLLKMAISRMASVATRNIATIGGNICNASPAGDTLPPLYVLDAKLHLISASDERILPIGDFIIGPCLVDLKDDEILEAVIIPKVNFDCISYHKAGTRRATALSKLSFVGLARVCEEHIEDIRIAFGAVAPKVVRSRETELTIIGADAKSLALMEDEIINSYSQKIRPINDQRSTAEYRKTVCLRLLRNYLKELI